MALNPQEIPNLINGVSQQPQTLRLASQADLMENGYPSVVEGLRKRFPTEYLATLKLGTLPDAALHSYERDRTEAYHVIVTNGDLEVYDIDGVQKTVNFPDGKSYLNFTGDSAHGAFAMTTVADFTFVVNKEQVCAMDSAVSGPMSVAALISVKAGNYSSDYKILIDGTTYASYTTLDSSVAANELDIRTNTIAATLVGLFKDTDTAGEFVIWHEGSTIFLYRADAGDFNVEVEDSQSGTSLKAAKKSVQKFTDLPTFAIDGFRVKVVGDEGIDGDDYYVQFAARNAPEDNTSEGVWEETIGPNVALRFDASTMPHVLVRESNGTFTFSEWDQWVDRQAGDDDTVPVPSFIGKTISDVVFFKNRLGFLSDDNVILSEAGEFGNFFKKTATALLDSDVIDVSASHRKVSLLKSAVPTKKQMICFSDKTQFVLEGADLLTPKTASIDPITEYEIDTEVTPVGAGKVIFFAVEKGSFTGIREYLVSEDENVTGTDAQDVTAHVPKYLPSGAFHMTASTTDDLLVFLSTVERNVVWLYKYFWAGDEKLQSAWSKWVFPTGTKVLSASFIAGDLNLIVQYPDGVHLLRVFTDPDRVDPEGEYLTHLDRRVTENGLVVAYDSVADETTFTAPYDILPETVVVTRATPAGTNIPGEILTEKSRTANSITVAGDESGRAVWLGDNYEFRYRFSTMYMRRATSNGSVPILPGRVQVKYMTLDVDRTGYFRVDVTHENRSPVSYYFEGRVLGSLNNLIDEVGLVTGEFRFPVMSRNIKVTVEIVNPTHLPSVFQSARWWGEHTVRERRSG